MSGLLALSRGIDRITTVIGRNIAWAILLAILVSATNAVIRKLFDSSSNAWLEMQWYLYGAAFMGAAAYTLLENEHIRIDILYNRRSRRGQLWSDLIGHLLFLMPFVALMVWMLVPYAWGSYLRSESSDNAGGLILWPAKSILAIGFILLFFQGISEIIKTVAKLRGVMPDTDTGSSHSHVIADAAGLPHHDAAQETRR